MSGFSTNVDGLAPGRGGPRPVVDRRNNDVPARSRLIAGQLKGTEEVVTPPGGPILVVTRRENEEPLPDEIETESDSSSVPFIKNQLFPWKPPQRDGTYAQHLALGRYTRLLLR